MGIPISEFLANIFLFVSLYFEVFLLLTFIERANSVKKKTLLPLAYPSATILVPVWNEATTVSKTLNSLLSLNYPKEKLKIIVIDDGSSDNTWSVLQDFNKDPAISLLRKENGGKYTALNLGLTHTTSDLVGCLDADSFVDSEALIRIAKHFENPKVMAVTPSIKVQDPKNIVQFIQRAEYHLSSFIRFVFSALNSQYITPGPFSIFRREVFEIIGNYKHAHNTEDMEMALRMQANYMKIENAHDAHVYTVTPATVYKLYKQRLRWIHGGLENMIDYKFMFFNRKYGVLSSFILPTTFICIGSALYFFLLVAKSIIMMSLSFAENVNAIGISNYQFNLGFSLDWFTNQITYLSIVGSIFSISIIVSIMMGKYIANDRVRVSRDIIFYIFLYGFIAPFWFLKAVYNTALSRKTSWR